MIRLHGELFINGFLEANNVTRYLQAEHQSTSPFWFFLPVLLGGFFPWSLALPGALVLAWRRLRDDWRKRLPVSPTLFLGLWVALVFVFFFRLAKQTDYLYFSAVPGGGGIGRPMGNKET